MSAIESAVLSSDAARAMTDEVKADAEHLWARLVSLYDGRAHIALGYESWGLYFKAEFGGEKSQAYRILEAGRVAEALGHSPIGELRPTSEAQARELTPLLRAPEILRETWHEAVEKYGDPTALQVRGLVERRRAPAASADPEALEARQRLLLINELDQAVTALEGMPSLAVSAANRILLGGGPGPFTPERLDRVAAYAAAFADTLRRTA